jgi:pyruvate/2-oxoglutarate dehydrogenase complex dihydrolipoamide dehydrogenase (E3) component
MPDFDFDLAVVGAGPAGHHAAIQGAKLRKRVVMIERKPLVGGICVNIGTIPSKTMGEAIMYLAGDREHAVYGDSYQVEEKITFQDLLVRSDPQTLDEARTTRKIRLSALVMSLNALEHARAQVGEFFLAHPADTT